MGGVLGAMFMGWPMFGASKEQVAGMTVRYLGAVAELPVWAVQEAVNRWRDGNWKLEFGESFDKIPSSATLKRIAEHERQMAENMLHSLEQVDAAVAEIPEIPQSPEDRARMAEKFKALSDELGKKISARSNAERTWPLKERFDAEHERRRTPQPKAENAEQADA